MTRPLPLRPMVPTVPDEPTEMHQPCACPNSFCLAASERYFRDLRARTGSRWREALIATPKRTVLPHGRVPDELIISDPQTREDAPRPYATLRFEPLMPGTLLTLVARHEAVSTATMQALLADVACSIERQFQAYRASVVAGERARDVDGKGGVDV